MTETSDEEPRRRRADGLRSELDDLQGRFGEFESAMYHRRQEIIALQGDMVSLRELVGNEIRASELISKLTVGIDDGMTHTTDTYILFDDNERAILRLLVKVAEATWLRLLDLAERDRETTIVLADHQRRRAWHETLWGRAGTVTLVAAGAVSIVAEVVHIITGH